MTQPSDSNAKQTASKKTAVESSAKADSKRGKGKERKAGHDTELCFF